MTKLLKYEFRKTWFTKMVLLIITALVEVFYLVSLYQRKDERTGIAIFLLSMVAILGLTVIGIQSFLLLYHELNSKQSYMLFMTPNSNYKILGAKVLENGLSILLGGAFFAGLAALDLTLLFRQYGEILDLYEMFDLTMQSFGVYVEITPVNALSLFGYILTDWFSAILIVFFTIVLSASFLAGRKINGIITFGLVILINWAHNYLVSLLPLDNLKFQTQMLISSCIALIVGVIMYLITCMIMDRKLSV